MSRSTPKLEAVLVSRGKLKSQSRSTPWQTIPVLQTDCQRLCHVQCTVSQPCLYLSVCPNHWAADQRDVAAVTSPLGDVCTLSHNPILPHTCRLLTAPLFPSVDDRSPHFLRETAVFYNPAAILYIKHTDEMVA